MAHKHKIQDSVPLAEGPWLKVQNFVLDIITGNL
jgi:hypothetical protein